MSDSTDLLLAGQSNRKWWTGGLFTPHLNNTSRRELLGQPWSHVDFTDISEPRLAQLQEPLAARKSYSYSCKL
jgi:hypothetical protein